MFFWSRKTQRLFADRDYLGWWGEKRCEHFLRKKGLKKLTANYSCNRGEIDLIMVDSDRTVVFVEVKTRTGEKLDAAESAITEKKKEKLLSTARHFIAVNNINNRSWRFDVVVIVLDEKARVDIRHYKNAFVG